MNGEERARLFNAAADRIENFGWWDGSTARSPDTECLWTAIITAAHIERIPLNRENTHEVLEPMLKHFDLTYEDWEFDRGFGQLFDLNDSQPAATGQKWAVTNLRELASEALVTA